jgi:DNA-binding transcriptional LysR family regulator
VQAAEEELGLQLFNRTTPEVSCTDAGAFVVERARKLLFENRCLERDVELYRERCIGDIAFGTGPYPAATLLLPLLKELRLQYPGIKTRVEVNNTVLLTEHLRSETLDFFVADMRNLTPSADLAVRPLGALAAGFYVRAGHPLLGQVTTLNSLLEYGVASVQVPTQVSLALGQLAGLPPGEPFPLALVCDDVQVLKGVGMATDTVIGCVVGGVTQELASGLLHTLQVTDAPPLSAQVCVVSLNGRTFSPMAAIAVEFLEALARKGDAP